MLVNLISNILTLWMSLCPINMGLEQYIMNDVEDIYIPDYINENPLIGEDNYESNDNYDDAINMSPDNFYEIDSYSTCLNATLFCTGMYPDYDFYYFTVFTDSYVTIDLVTSVINCKFSLVYFNYNTYSTDANNFNAPCDPVTLFDFENQQMYKNYDGLLKPGTYFIYLDNLFDYTSVIDYQLSLVIRKTDDAADANINDLIFNKECDKHYM